MCVRVCDFAKAAIAKHSGLRLLKKGNRPQGLGVRQVCRARAST